VVLPVEPLVERELGGAVLGRLEAEEEELVVRVEVEAREVVRPGQVLLVRALVRDTGEE
jgi:hypothetical protein